MAGKKVIIAKYKDGKDAHVRTTLHENKTVEANNRQKPNSVKEYNTYMGGVDCTDKVG